MSSFAYLLQGPPDDKIYEACKRSIKELNGLNGKEEIREGKHPYVSSVILDRHGNILKDRYGKKLIALTDPINKKHAEAIVIEKLLSSGDDIIRKAHTLITTLEPCSYRNTASHPAEIACAKLITFAGIKQVIIGILDPAVTVRGRGLALLDQWGVYYGMFPSELADEIRKKNEKYIEKNGVSWKGYYQNEEPTISPYAEFELAYAPDAIREFMDKEEIKSLLYKIIKGFYQKEPEYKKGRVAKVKQYYTNLSEFIEYQLHSHKGPAKVLINKLKNESTGVPTVHKKIQQYIGYPLRDYENKKDYEKNRDTFMLFVMLNWLLAEVRSRS